jgi:hypothetical protein
MVTLAPAAGAKTMGPVDVPEFVTVTWSVYVPEATITVVPAVALAPAALIVQSGCVLVPGPESEQLALFMST